MNLKNKKVLVYGLGKSGIGAIKLLKKLKAKIFVYDDNIEVLNNFNDNLVTKIDCITENLLSNINLIVVNPCVSIYNEHLKLANILNKKIISEIELAYLFCKGKIIALTGSNGKTTTSTLTYNIFKENNCNCSLVGNVGTSFADVVSVNPKQTFVVEVSSFQLETINKFRANTACFLNFSENHLDRHFSLDNYFKTKCKIFKNSKHKDYKILNYDDKTLQNIPKTKNTYYFSLNQMVKGTYVKEGYIYFYNGKTQEQIIDLSCIKLIGEHNIENVLCSVLIAKLNKIKTEVIERVVKNFYGINHRIEYSETINFVKFYNDSKSTTIKATQTALNCFKEDRVLLILGGSNKENDYNELFINLPSQVKQIIAIGEIREKILKIASLYNFKNIIAFDDFNMAIKNSYFLSLQNCCNVVLFSPATASYDMFKNFEERGDCFKNIVKEIKSEN